MTDTVEALRLEPMDRNWVVGELCVRMATDVLIRQLGDRSGVAVFDRELEVTTPPRQGVAPAVYRWRCRMGDTSARDGTTWLSLILAPCELVLGAPCPACGNRLTKHERQTRPVYRWMQPLAPVGRVIAGPDLLSCDAGHSFESARPS